MSHKNALHAVLALVLVFSVLASPIFAQADGTAPIKDAISVNIISPQDGSVSFSRLVTLSYSATSAESLRLSCNANVYQGSNTVKQKVSLLSSGSTASFSSVYPDGTYAWEVICTTPGGVAVSSTRIFSVTETRQANQIMGFQAAIDSNVLLVILLVVLVGILALAYLSTRKRKASSAPASKKRSKGKN